MNKPNKPQITREQLRILKRNRKEQRVGIVVALIIPAFVASIFQERYPLLDLTAMNNVEFNFFISNVLMISVIINSIIFGIGLRLKRDGLARGVLLGSFAAAACLIYFKFIA